MEAASASAIGGGAVLRNEGPWRKNAQTMRARKTHQAWMYPDDIAACPFSEETSFGR